MAHLIFNADGPNDDTFNQIMATHAGKNVRSSDFSNQRLEMQRFVVLLQIWNQFQRIWMEETHTPKNSFGKLTDNFQLLS